jgi:DNA polymerase III delta prime subunit
MSIFKKAVKHESKLRLAITGPSGAGKTYTALAVATSMGGKVAVVDTEHGSASKYADAFQFDVMELTAPYSPARFVEAIRDAAAEGYSIVILDSLSHAWNGTGGILDIVDEIAKRKTNGNTFAAWKEGTPIQNQLIEGIVGAPIHVIATLRSKQDHVQEKDDRGKTVIRKVGMSAQQREGFEYEFDVVMDMDIDHNGIVTKSRASALADRVFPKPGKDVAKVLTEWLTGAPEEKPALADVQTVDDIKAQMVRVYGDGWAAFEETPAMWASGKKVKTFVELTQAQAEKVMAQLEKKPDYVAPVEDNRLVADAVPLAY